MNGVRRFLGAAAIPTSPPPDPPAPLQSSPPIVPLNAKSGPSWPPSSPTSSGQPPSPYGSPKTTTAALFLRKDKQRPPMPPLDDEAHNRGRSNSSSSMASAARNSQASSARSSPNLSRKPLPPTLPVSGPSSPVGRVPTRKPVGGGDPRASGLLNTRDELLLSLLASEAVVESRDFAILSSEEVEELKKEEQFLSSRLGATTKKLATETKIRDAALSLSKVNAPHKKVSKQTDEQLDAANRRVETTQKELWKVSERANEVHRKLVEHRAGVLSFSVRTMEKKMAPSTPQLNGIGDGDSGYDTSNTMSPISVSTAFSTAFSTGSSSKTAFDGAHLFAGHADAVVPARARSPESAQREITSLELKLKAAMESLTAAGKKQAENNRELQILRLEKQQVETMMGMELQSAEDTIAALEKELPNLEGLGTELEALKEEKVAWEEERLVLIEREKQAEERLSALEASQAEKLGVDALLSEVRETSRIQLEQKDQEIRQLQAEWDSDRAAWERERAELEDEKMEDLARLQEEMDRLREDDEVLLREATKEVDEGRLVVQSLVQTHGIVLFSRDSSLKGLIAAIGGHLDGLAAKLDARNQAEAEWESVKRKLEEDVRAGFDKREALSREVEEARREREEARREARDLETRVRDSSNIRSPVSPAQGFAFPPPVEYTGDAASIVALLRPVWSILPSPEARAAKFGQRTFRTGSGPSSPTISNSPIPGSPTVKSISDLDVRSLKSLYDTRSSASASSSAAFSVENFVARVQALIADDKALIERLLRFAQAHDLLKKNAERAQKLAQESNGALETYQKQVRTLEERNMALSTKHAQMADEVQQLQDAVDRISIAKSEIEMHAAEQAETCRQLTEANNTLSARALALAEEAASAPEMVKKQLETQLAETKAALKAAQDEVDAMRSSAQTQNIMLMDELMVTQTENSELKDQLRALKK